jgi:hypothetical protein
MAEEYAVLVTLQEAFTFQKTIKILSEYSDHVHILFAKNCLAFIAENKSRSVCQEYHINPKRIKVYDYVVPEESLLISVALANLYPPMKDIKKPDQVTIELTTDCKQLIVTPIIRGNANQRFPVAVRPINKDMEVVPLKAQEKFIKTVIARDIASNFASLTPTIKSNANCTLYFKVVGTASMQLEIRNKKNIITNVEFGESKIMYRRPSHTAVLPRELLAPLAIWKDIGLQGTLLEITYSNSPDGFTGIKLSQDVGTYSRLKLYIREP